MLTRDRENVIRCLSNVCTHRGMLICPAEGLSKSFGVRIMGVALAWMDASRRLQDLSWLVTSARHRSPHEPTDPSLGPPGLRPAGADWGLAEWIDPVEQRLSFCRSTSFLWKERVSKSLRCPLIGNSTWRTTSRVSMCPMCTSRWLQPSTRVTTDSNNLQGDRYRLRSAGSPHF